MIPESAEASDISAEIELPGNDGDAGGSIPADAPGLPFAEPAQPDLPIAPSGWVIAKAILREVIETVVLALIMVFLIQLVIRNFKVDGHSMDPNLHHGQYLIVDKISYHLPFNLRPPRRGDVIVFAPPIQPNTDFVKRIIGLPGDTVELKAGQIYINHQPLANSFGALLDQSTMRAILVPDGELFVLGDNRANSNDSRSWGTLKMDSVVGKAWVSYWPPSTWGVIPNNLPTSSATLFQSSAVNQTTP